MNNLSDLLFKILLIGNSGAGKSCMLMRYAENAFTNNFYNTIGVDFVFNYIVKSLENKNYNNGLKISKIADMGHCRLG